MSVVAIGTPSYSYAQEAEQDAQTILVLDASGSMWGQLDGRHKIEIARDVISETVNDWDEDTEIGLMAYGHNREGDCSDIELLVPPGRLDKEAFAAQASRLNPKGKTPLTAAVRQAANVLGHDQRKATVILISDGKETCDLDPCAVGAALEETGVDFTAHIIGFDVPKEDTVGMRCLAEATGGLYLDAENAGDLSDALKDTRALADSSTEALDRSAATLSVPAEIIAGTNFPATWTGPANRGDYLIVRTPDSDETGDLEPVTHYVTGDARPTPIEMTAPEEPGVYDVHYEVSHRDGLAKVQLNVVAPTASIDAPAEVLAGSVFEVMWTGPENEYDELVIYTKDNAERMGSRYAYDPEKSIVSMTAPEDAGAYEIILQTRRGRVLSRADLQVTPASATLRIDQDVIVGGNRVDVFWTGPANRNDEISVYDIDGTARLSRVFVKPEKSNEPAVIELPEAPGDYLVRYMTAEDDNELAALTVSVIQATGTISAPSVVPAKKRFEVDWSGPQNRRDRITIFSMDGSERFHGAGAGQSRSSPAKLIAPDKPGTYRVKLLSGDKNELASTTFTVE